jgi:hypothetical protein
MGMPLKGSFIIRRGAKAKVIGFSRIGAFRLSLKIGRLTFTVMLISMIFISGSLDYLITYGRRRKGKLTLIEVKSYGKNVCSNSDFYIQPNRILRKNSDFI